MNRIVLKQARKSHEENPFLKFLPLTLGILTPIVGYIFAIRYEEGYAKVFQIAPELVSVTTQSIYIAGTSIFTLVLILMNALFFGYLVVGEKYGGLCFFLIGTGLSGIWLYFLKDLWLYLLFADSVATLLYISVKNPPKNENIEAKNRFDKWILLFWKNHYVPRIDKAFFLVRRHLFAGMVVFVFLVLIGFIYSKVLGEDEARRKMTFSILEYSLGTKFVLLRKYDDVLVLALFQKEHCKISGEKTGETLLLYHGYSLKKSGDGFVNAHLETFENVILNPPKKFISEKCLAR